ncbi:MAG: transcriptional repressor [Candidatus Nomurabacteria bacterium]|nr:transcriptional repressor [Candidatus Nomurabacteria bacterium]
MAKRQEGVQGLRQPVGRGLRQRTSRDSRRPASRSLRRPTLGRNSRQRELVARSVLNRYDHPTAEMVLITARKADPKISLGTVYRNLDWLATRGDVKKFVVPDGADRYDATAREHYHAVCERCGRIFDIELRLAKKITDVARRQAELEVDKVQLIASGVCQRCKYKS